MNSLKGSYKELSLLGEGGFGRCVRALNKLTGEEVCVKIEPKDGDVFNKKRTVLDVEYENY